MRYLLIAFIILFQVTGSEEAVAQKKVNWKKANVLLYTKNGKGFVHDNIPNSIEAIKALAAQNGFKLDVSEDPGVFTDENLKRYDALIFSNTNHDVFDTDATKVAFMRFFQAGGGFVAIPSASGTDRSWKWVKDRKSGG